jgi:hypothetical protein
MTTTQLQKVPQPGDVARAYGVLDEKVGSSNKQLIQKFQWFRRQSM